jgi:hypothetical protein
MLEGEICTRDKHMFGTELETLLKSRMRKNRRFLERADFLVAASRRTFAATGQTTLRTYFLSATPPGPNNCGTLQTHTEEEPGTQPSENIQVIDPSIHPAVSLNQEQTIEDPHFFTRGSDRQNSPPTAPI